MNQDAALTKIMSVHAQMIWDRIPIVEANAEIEDATREMVRLSTRASRLDAFLAEVGNQPATRQILEEWWTAKQVRVLDEVIDRVTSLLTKYDELGSVTREHAKAFLSDHLGMI